MAIQGYGEVTVVTESDVRDLLRTRCDQTSQAKVANDAGVSRQLVCMMIHGVKPVSGRVRDLLGVDRNKKGRPKGVDRHVL